MNIKDEQYLKIPTKEGQYLVQFPEARHSYLSNIVKNGSKLIVRYGPCNSFPVDQYQGKIYFKYIGEIPETKCEHLVQEPFRHGWKCVKCKIFFKN